MVNTANIWHRHANMSTVLTSAQHNVPRIRTETRSTFIFVLPSCSGALDIHHFFWQCRQSSGSQQRVLTGRERYSLYLPSITVCRLRRGGDNYQTAPLCSGSNIFTARKPGPDWHHNTVKQSLPLVCP